MFGKLATVVGTGALALVGYEIVQRWKATHGSITLVPGHQYVAQLNYTKDPVAPVTQQMAQDALNVNAPGEFDVINAQMTPGPSGLARQMTVTFVASGGSTSVPATLLTQNWPAGFGSVSLASPVVDNGGVQ